MCWYLLQSKPRQEHIAELNLQRQGYHCFLPRLRSEKLLRGKLTDVSEALFPGYLFVDLDETRSWSPIRSTVGVKDLVRFGSRIVPVAPALIAELRQRTAQAPMSSLFSEGDRVCITQGAFAGLEAVFHCRKGADRVIVLIHLLQSEHLLEVPPVALSRCG